MELQKPIHTLNWTAWRAFASEIWNTYEPGEVIALADRMANCEAVPINGSVAIVIAVLAKAYKGDMVAWEKFMDRMYGKVPQQMQVESNVNVTITALESLPDDELEILVTPLLQRKTAPQDEARLIDAATVTDSMDSE